MVGQPSSCPKCYGRCFFASKSGGLRVVLQFLLVRPFRCANGHARLWRFAPLPGRTRPAPTAPAKVISQKVEADSAEAEPLVGLEPAVGS